MNLKFSALILIITAIEFSKSDKNSCKIKLDTLKNEMEKLQKTFNLTLTDPQPSNCSEYQSSIVKIIGDIDYEKSGIDKEQSPEFQELKQNYQIQEKKIEENYQDEKKRLEDEFTASMQEVETKIENINQEINKIRTEQNNLMKNHRIVFEKFNKCDEEFKTYLSPINPVKRFGVAPEKPFLCIVTHQWLQELKILADTKVTSSFNFNETDDCGIKRKWFLDLNNILMEANLKALESFSLESYRIGLQKHFDDKKKIFVDSIFQLTQEHQRLLKAATDRLQDLNSDLQQAKQNFNELKAQQNAELEQLGLKLIECNRFDLALQMVDEVESKTFMRKILMKEYEMSTSDDKADRILIFIAEIQQICRKFEAFLILYDAIKGSSQMESPTIIEVIEQIRELRSSAKNCGIEYDENNFSSTTLATDPTVNKILDILSDSIKVQSFEKLVNFNYYFPMTFGKILPTLVEKSYTGNNLDILLKFEEDLYWLLYKYDVLDKLLTIRSPSTAQEKDLFIKSVKKTSQTETRFYEHDARLGPLKHKMMRLGMKM